MPISVPPKGDADKRIGSYFAPLQVEAQVAPDLTVKIRAGSLWTALAEHVEYAGGNSPPITAPASDAKWVVITINENGLINTIDGASGTSPDLPAIPETEIPLAGIFIGDTATEITSDMVMDIRPLWQLRAEAITDLQGELDARPTIVDVNALLALKADIGGTPAETFLFNQDHVGVAGADISLEVERGSNPNVNIRWNETSEKWEFTNDGSTYADIGAAAGSFYTQTQLDTGQLDSQYYTKSELDPAAAPAANVLDARYYTEVEVDAGFAPLAHTQSWTTIPDFAAGVSATAGITFAPIVHTHVAADVTDFAAEAVLAGTGTFAPFAHTHLAVDVTDFSAAADARIAAAIIDDLSDVSLTPLSTGQVLYWQGAFFTNSFLSTDDLSDVDTTTTAPVLNDAMLWDGISQFVNRAIIKTDVSDFSETDYVHTTGTETILGDKTFGGDVTIGGGIVDITATQLQVADPYIELNFGVVASTVDGGIRIARGTTGPDAVLEWDETTDTWQIGVVGTVNQILTAVHTHVVAAITDFGAGVTAQLAVNNADALLDITYPVAPVLNDFLLRDGAGQFNATSFSTAVTTELGLNQVEDIGDVNTYAALAAQDALMWDGAGWQNRPVVKADVSDFTETDYVHTTGVETIAGNKTFSNDVIVNGDLTINGTTTTIDTANLTVEDNIIEVNKGEAGAGVGGGAGNAGIQVDRGSLTDAILVWDELNTQWEAGVVGLTAGISLVGHTHLQADITDVAASAAEVSFLVGVTSLVQTQLNDKISRAGDTMDAGANLSFSATGEVLGLPATPSATAATSKEYVDAQLALQDELGELTDVDLNGAGAPATPTLADRDVLIYDLTNTRWQNRPFIEADISDLGLTILENSDIGVNVQAWDTDLDTIAGFAHTGDEMIYSAAGTWATTATTAFGRGLLNETDAASTRTTLDLYSATQLDAGQLDNQYYTETELDAGQLDNRYYTEVEADGAAGSAGAKIDKVTPAVAGNLAELDAAGELVDSGVATADVLVLVSPFVLGNIVDLDATGNIVDAGIASADLLTLTTTGEIAHTLGNLGDVTDGSSTGDYLIKTAGDWQNIAPAAMSDFVRTQGSIAEAISGVKTFSDNLIVDGDLTVNGTTTTVNSTNLDVTDTVIRLNDGYVGVPFTGGIGVEANRTGAAVANWLWDENGSIGLNTVAQRWVGGLAGSEVAFAVENSTPAQPLYELFVGTGAGLPTYVSVHTVPVPPGGSAGIQVFVNGIKQIEGAAKAYTVGGYGPVTITFTAGNEPAVADDVEIYAFGTIG